MWRPAPRWRSACALLAACALPAACGDPPATSPNLLLVTVDTLRADRLACYGGKADVGAELCALAEGGTRFAWALAPAPYTAPSVASILTSRYPRDHGVSQSALSFLEADAVSVAEVLRDAGYTTAGFVSNPVLSRNRSLDQGFDVYDQQMNRRERNRVGFRERDAAAATRAALAWARVGAREPWFLWVHYQDPHGPYDPPDAPPQRDAPGDARLPRLADHSGHGGIPAYQALDGLQTVPAYERAYASEVRFVAEQVAWLVAGLDALGRPPAVLLTADHGEAFGEDDYWFAHGHSVALDQIHVPLLWRPAEPGPAAVADGPVTLLDVAPTLLHVAGVDAPASFDGVPLPVAGAPPAPPDRPLFAEHEMRTGVAVGRLYYARDARPVVEGERDPISGGARVALPPRGTRLGAASGAADEAEALEPLVAAFEKTGRRTAPRREEIPSELREQLIALGYLD